MEMTHDNFDMKELAEFYRHCMNVGGNNRLIHGEDKCCPDIDVPANEKSDDSDDDSDCSSHGNIDIPANEKSDDNDDNDERVCKCKCEIKCCEYGDYSPPLWCGWMRCYVCPYLTNGKIVHEIHEGFREIKGDDFCKFKACLLYSLQDYLDYINCFSHMRNKDTYTRTMRLINNLEKIDESELILLIEKNFELFPTITDAKKDDIMLENWNDNLKNKRDQDDI